MQSKILKKTTPITEKDKQDIRKIQTEPNVFATQILGCKPWPMQSYILDAISKNKEVAVASCHAAGKSWLSARATLWFLYTRKHSRVVTTAPTFDQVRDILWQEIRQAHNESKKALGGKMLDTRLDLGPNWFATGRSTDDANRFQGAHSAKGSIFVVADEAAGIKSDIWTGIDGILTSDDSHLLAIGNPTSPSGEFFDMYRRPGVIKIHISAFDTPNFTEFGVRIEDIRNGDWRQKITSKLPAPWLITPDWVADKWQKWCGGSKAGEENPLWVSRVMGQFPKISKDTLIQLNWITDAQNRILEPSDPATLGCDIARYGEDETVIVYRQGTCARVLTTSMQESTMQTSGRIIQALRSTSAIEARIDADGLGAGVFDRLNEQGQPVVEMRSGGSARDKEQFLNARAEWYWGLRERFEKGEIAIDKDEELAAQLSDIKYKFTSRGQIQIESKDEMKRRGVHSPDRADALMLAFANIAKQGIDLNFNMSALTSIKGESYRPPSF
jgi:phage terminase large subunit